MLCTCTHDMSYSSPGFTVHRDRFIHLLSECFYHIVFVLLRYTHVISVLYSTSTTIPNTDKQVLNLYSVDRPMSTKLSLYAPISDGSLVTLFDIYNISHVYRSAYVCNYSAPVYREDTLVINEIVHVSITVCVDVFVIDM